MTGEIGSIEWWKEQCGGALAAIRQKEAEISRLRAALKPFAEFARVYIEEMGAARKPDEARLVGANEAHLTVGDMRAALNALEES